jgi:hypothetical protein
MLEACVSLGQIVALRPHQAGFTFNQVENDAAPSRALTQAKSGPYAASSGLHFRSNRDRRHAPVVRLLRPNRGLTPHQADFIFGQIGTDATLQAYAYSGQIVALRRIKRTSSSVRSGPTPRSRRVLTQAKSGPSAASRGLHLRSDRDRRHAPGVRLLRPNRGLTPHQADFIFGQIGTDATLQACAYSGQIVALRRIKRTSSSVRSGPTPRSRRALTQAKSGPYAASSGLHLRSRRSVTGLARAHSMRSVPMPLLTPPKATTKTMPPQGGSIASTTLRNHDQKEKNLGTKGWGNTDLYYMSETGYKGPPC